MALRSVSVVSASGLLLFTAALAPGGAHPPEGGARLLSALVTTLARLATNVCGGSLRLISYEHVHVYVALPPDAPAGVVLTLERDSHATRDEVLALGAALCAPLLSGFLDEFGGGLEAAGAGAHALSTYREWGLRLPAIVQDALRSQLRLLALVPGVERASLVSGDDGTVESFTSPDAAPGRARDVDDHNTALVVGLRPLVATASELRECTVAICITCIDR